MGPTKSLRDVSIHQYNYVFAEAPPLRLNSLTGEPLTPKTEPPNQSWTEPITPTGKSCVLAIAYMCIHNMSMKKQGCVIPLPQNLLVRYLINHLLVIQYLDVLMYTCIVGVVKYSTNFLTLSFPIYHIFSNNLFNFRDRIFRETGGVRMNRVFVQSEHKKNAYKFSTLRKLN